MKPTFVGFINHWNSKKTETMEPLSTNVIIANSVAQVLGVFVGALVGAVLIRLGMSWIARYKPRFGSAYKAALLGYLACLGLDLFIKGLFRLAGEINSPLQIVLTLSLGFFLQSFVYSRMISDEDGKPLVFFKALLLSLFQLIVVILLAGVLLLISMLIVGAH